MKATLTLLFCLAICGLALAQGAGYGGKLGIYFSETEFNQSTMTVQAPAFTPLRMYIVLTDAQYDGPRAYECGIEPMSTDIIFLSLGGPPGMLNIGDLNSHIVGFPDAQPVDDDGNCVLSWLDCLPLTDQQIDLVMGPCDIPSIPGWDGPAMVFDHNWDLIYHLDLSSGAHGYPDVVAIINPVPVAVESHTLSDVKALFE